MNTIPYHRQHPEVSVDQHVRARQIELANSLPPKALYLDTKFWLIGRDVVRHVRTGADDVGLVEQLDRLVAAGRIFCPISEPVLIEVLKQEDRSSRRATAEMIDRWSLGVSLIHPQRRMATELAHYFHEADRLGGVFTLDELVWTKLPFVMGEMHPTETGFDAATELAVQKAFFDHQWDLPMATMIDHLASASAADVDVDRQDLAQTLNEGAVEFAYTISDFHSAYAEEARGVADLLQDVGLEILRDMALRKGVCPPPGDSSEDRIEVRALIAGQLHHTAVQMKLRTSYILASIHAAVRAAKGRKFKSNDLFDFDHAAAALGYCDAFFTDDKLAKLLTRAPLEFDERFDCPIIADSASAIEALGRVVT